MKKIFLSILCIALYGVAVAQDNLIGNVSISPSHLFASTLDLGVEGKMSNKIGLMLRGQLGYRGVDVWENLGGKYYTWGGRLELRNYIGKNYDFNEGPYWSSWIKGQHISVKAKLQGENYDLYNSNTLNTGLGLGWKFEVSRRLQEMNFDIGVGIGYKFGDATGKYAARSRSIIFKDEGLVPMMTFRVGFSGVPEFRPKPKPIKKDPAPLLDSKEVAASIAFHDKLSSKQRKTIEKALQKKGFDLGHVNRKFDEKTIEAIKKFQRKYKIEADGRVGPVTLKRLGLKFD